VESPVSGCLLGWRTAAPGPRPLPTAALP